MSIRQDFIDAYMQRWGCSNEYAENLMAHLEIEHAHALAERIRANTEPLRGTVTGDSIRSIVNELAADLIDPEVTA